MNANMKEHCRKKRMLMKDIAKEDISKQKFRLTIEFKIEFECFAKSIVIKEKIVLESSFLIRNGLL